VGPAWTLAASALAMVPLAGLIGEATEALAYHTGPRVGGLLNATLGNAAELIISVVAIREGLLELVKASITGSILGNLLFVSGEYVPGAFAIANAFDRQRPALTLLLILAVTAPGVPSFFSQASAGIHNPTAEALAWVANLCCLYVPGWSAPQSKSPLSRPSADPAVTLQLDRPHGAASWSRRDRRGG
jgi:Ca2+:H+ antiporter